MKANREGELRVYSAPLEKSRFVGRRSVLAGFTLFELIIVVVIVTILAAIGAGYYRKVTIKAKVAKAKNAVSLIIEAEKIYRLDNGTYVNISYGNVNATVGAGVTGINLAAVDNDRDFRYQVTGIDLIRARPRVAIGTCPASSSGEIRYTLSTGIWTVPACYQR
jgi:prepilin-type N-terminal cleavage/methylation domain-containing protein